MMVFVGFLSLAAIVCFLSLEVSLSVEEIMKRETIEVIHFYEDKIIDDIEIGDVDEKGWNRKVKFANGDLAYVKIHCEGEYISPLNKVYQTIFKNEVKDSEYECTVKEL